VGFGVADGFEPLRGRGGVERAQIGHLDRQRTVPDALGAVAQDVDAQHRVAGGQLRRRGAEPVGIDAEAVEFDVEVGGDAAEFGEFVAADPQRVLDGRQREGGVRVTRVGADGFGGGRLGHVLADEFGPGRDGRIRCHRREAHVDALLTPAAGQRHHADRVQTGGDQIGLRRECGRVDTE
jgi:hypothetical protein